MAKSEKQIDKRNVFVVHGRNSDARRALFQFLRSIGLHPIEWSQAVEATGKATPYVGEVLDAAFSMAQAAVILFTPDDEARLKEDYRGDNEPNYEIELTGQARPNVIFEAGMAMGLYPDRTVIVELGNLRPISDITGRHVIRLNNSTPKRQELANRLNTAGCSINLSGTDWHDEGNFDLSYKSNARSSKLNIYEESNKIFKVIRVRLISSKGITNKDIEEIKDSLENSFKDLIVNRIENSYSFEMIFSEYISDERLLKGISNVNRISKYRIEIID